LVLFFIIPPLSPEGKHALQHAESYLRDDGQQRDGEGPGEQDLRTAALETLDYQVTQTTGPDERRQGGARDGLHGGGADAGEDHGGGYRHLYAGQDLISREPHPPGCADDALVDLPEPRRGVYQDRRDGERRERHQRRRETDPEERQGQCQDGEARYGAPDVADVDGYRRADPRVAYHHGDG
jgi:hypothetical protein